mmetsp:Transcript_25771/g.55216  ORF Transcript_25771/g.55216 Transcript_25771/m.55216 type:complete len:91 (-) Transcript_25771:662-934(-)
MFMCTKLIERRLVYSLDLFPQNQEALCPFPPLFLASPCGPLRSIFFIFFFPSIHSFIDPIRFDSIQFDANGDADADADGDADGNGFTCPW